MVVLMALSTASAGTPAVTEQMHERYLLVTDARDALIRGDLAHAQNSAGQLVEMESVKVPRRWKAWLSQLDYSASQLEGADDLQTASVALGNVAAACGNCHVAEKGGPELGAIGDLPPPEWSEGQNMSLHRWAMHWMWLGLIKGDDDVWKRGASELDNKPMAFRFGEAAPAELQALEQRVYGIAAQGLETNRSGRGALMGQLVGTCSECHTKLHTGPAGPSAQPIEPDDTTPDLESEAPEAEAPEAETPTP